MEKVYVIARKRTKRFVSRLPLDTIRWSEKQKKAFSACKAAIKHRTTLAHREETMQLCIYTDASDTPWSRILTQVAREKPTLPRHETKHEPPALHYGRLSSTQFGWSTLEKEAIPVLATMERSHWLA